VNRNILYYHGCVVDYFDHETGRAVIRLLEKNSCKVEVPDLICCSFPLLNSGDILTARERGAKLIDTLSKYVDRGYQVVYSCPTCGYTLRETYPKLFNSELARRLAEKTNFISNYLLEQHNEGDLNVEFKETSLRVAYHTPCHLRAQDLSIASAELLSLIPGLEVHILDRGCCGMGGNWAFRSKQRGELSAEIGAPIFNEIQEGDWDLVTTDCFGCQIQISRHTHYRLTHPAQILAEAYD
jgi:glycerol-3-phosphate dehydrogenase subunit C